MNWAKLVEPILKFFAWVFGFFVIKKSGKDAEKLKVAKAENKLRKDYAAIDNAPDSDDPAGDL